MMGAIKRVFKNSLPRNSYRINAMAAGTPMAVDRTAVNEPSTREFLKASRMVELCESLTNHLKLKPSIGKDPNCWGLKARRTTATMGVNIQTYTRSVNSFINDHPEIHVLIASFPL
jgi:hypothetical protein